MYKPAEKSESVGHAGQHLYGAKKIRFGNLGDATQFDGLYGNLARSDFVFPFIAMGADGDCVHLHRFLFQQNIHGRFRIRLQG